MAGSDIERLIRARVPGRGGHDPGSCRRRVSLQSDLHRRIVSRQVTSPAAPSRLRGAQGRNGRQAARLGAAKRRSAKGPRSERPGRSPGWVESHSPISPFGVKFSTCWRTTSCVRAPRPIPTGRPSRSSTSRANSSAAVTSSAKCSSRASCNPCSKASPRRRRLPPETLALFSGRVPVAARAPARFAAPARLGASARGAALRYLPRVLTCNQIHWSGALPLQALLLLSNSTC
jgi:hypothetical protein